MGESLIPHVDGNENPVDLLTKVLCSGKRMYLVNNNILYVVKMENSSCMQTISKYSCLSILDPRYLWGLKQKLWNRRSNNVPLMDGYWDRWLAMMDGGINHTEDIMPCQPLTYEVHKRTGVDHLGHGQAINAKRFQTQHKQD